MGALMRLLISFFVFFAVSPGAAQLLFLILCDSFFDTVNPNGEAVFAFG